MDKVDAFLFLDIDGVMTPGHGGPVNYLKTRDQFEDRENAFSEEATLCLNSILNHFPGLGIVLTTQIRLGKDKDWCQAFLTNRGIDGSRVIGRTPPDTSVRFYPDSSFEIFESVPRGMLIQVWLQVWCKKHNLDGAAFIDQKYVILDDSVDMLYTQRNRFVKCRNSVGLNEAVAKKVDHLLRKQGVFRI